MRKKSHILVAKYLADTVSTEELLEHKKAFCLGSILPDLKPSFLTTKHEFNGTFSSIQDKIRLLTEECDLDNRNSRVYCRRFGEVIHYIADYFTFPHNNTYPGTLAEHCIYEKELKNTLKSYIVSGKVQEMKLEKIHFNCIDELIQFVSESHERYLRKQRNVADDIRYILTVCFQVVQGIVQLLLDRIASEGYLVEERKLAFQA